MITTGLLLLLSLLYKFFPPKKINPYFGYRTAMSTKSQETWNFANKYASMWMVRYFAFLFLVAMICYSWPLPLTYIELGAIPFVIACFFGVIRRTEKYLGMLFDKEGRRRID